MARIVVAGSFDTKAQPLGLLLAMLRARGHEPVVIDVSVFDGDPAVTWPAAEVAARAGRSHSDLAAQGRAAAVGAMAEGAAMILADLVAQGQVGALVVMGGSNAATVFSRLAPVLPLGLPKILMATAVAGDTRPIIGAADAVLMYPVVDVDGDSDILRQMIARLADTAVALAASSPFAALPRRGRTVALSMYGVTTPCVQRVAGLLRKAGAEPLVFHANGTGGRSIEDFAAQGLVDAVVDATLAELGNELLGGAFPAGPDRLQGAARAGVPQVIAPGAIDMIAFGPRSSVPQRYEGHTILAHNALVTLVRTKPDECHAIGARLAQRLGTPGAPCVVCVPLGGTSMLDRPGEAFHDPAAVRAFCEGLRAGASTAVQIIESPLNINDPGFADLLFEQLEQVLTPGSERPRQAANPALRSDN